ncbi:MAG: hypothetical protein AAF221_02345 [Pseudomonadota bacterium]
MTKALHTLVRLREMELDALRREVAIFYREIDAIEDKQRDLSKQLVNEQVYLTRMEGVTTYALFAQSAREWQAELEQEKVAAESKVASKMAQISQAFEALKTAQIARDNAVAKENERRAKADQDALDEAALTRFARQDDPF